ncbi:MAG: hypothetical protein ACK8QZ_00250 [Anaerolineales bacterium]
MPDYRVLIWVGGGLVVLGALLPFLMVLQVLPSTFFLAFLSYASSVAGLFLGMLGISIYIRIHRPPDE